jgi:hypothetical protein
MVEPEVARASNALWASAASLTATSSEPRDRSSAEFGSHEANRFPRKHEFPNILMRDRTFHKFIIITIIVPLEHDPIGKSFRRPPCSMIYAPS